MKRIRYLTLLMVLLCGIVARAQDEFNPISPAEPNQIPTKLILVANPKDGGSVSGANTYTPGTSVTAYASPSTGFDFVNWTNEKGEIVSTERSYSFIKGDVDEKLTANFSFNPSAPKEPTEELVPRYRLTLVAEEGGSVSGDGVYGVGESITIRANTNSYFDFVGWYDNAGTLKSADANYTFPMTNQPLTLTAKFKFNPNSPSEPDELFGIFALNLSAEEGGSVSVSPSGNKFQVGTSLQLYAYTNSGYEFTGWYKDGEFYTADASTSYTMENKAVSFKAHYKYVPDSPKEPTPAGERTFSFTLYNVNCKPGDTIDYPIYLTWKEKLKDMSFQLTFKGELQPDLANVTLSDKASGYTLNRTDGEAPEGYNAYVYTLTGGTLEDEGNTILLNFRIPIPSDMETGLYYPVTINQISMTTADDTTQTAAGRNGRVSVYKNGDSNGDNEVDIFDVTNVVSDVLGTTPEVFIKEVSDVNEDDEIDIFDVTGIVTIILGE